MGLIVKRSDKRAFKWYLKAAEQGNTEAQRQVGTLYELGQGVDQDYERAFELSLAELIGKTSLALLRR